MSNFYESPVEIDGITYGSAEAAYQAQKTEDMEERKKFCTMRPIEAKKMGRRVKLRDGFNAKRVSIMFNIITAKFSQNEELKNKLLATGNEELVEGNTWGDRFWGVCNGVGSNGLGKILMRVRDDLSHSEIK